MSMKLAKPPQPMAPRERRAAMFGCLKYSQIWINRCRELADQNPPMLQNLNEIAASIQGNIDLLEMSKMKAGQLALATKPKRRRS
jgi:hypothetical protein